MLSLIKTILCFALINLSINKLCTGMADNVNDCLSQSTSNFTCCLVKANTGDITNPLKFCKGFLTKNAYLFSLTKEANLKFPSNLVLNTNITYDCGENLTDINSCGNLQNNFNLQDCSKFNNLTHNCCYYSFGDIKGCSYWSNLDGNLNFSLNGGSFQCLNQLNSDILDDVSVVVETIQLMNYNTLDPLNVMTNNITFIKPQKNSTKNYNNSLIDNASKNNKTILNRNVTENQSLNDLNDTNSNDSNKAKYLNIDNILILVFIFNLL